MQKNINWWGPSPRYNFVVIQVTFDWLFLLDLGHLWWKQVLLDKLKLEVSPSFDQMVFSEYWSFFLICRNMNWFQTKRNTLRLLRFAQKAPKLLLNSFYVTITSKIIYYWFIYSKSPKLRLNCWKQRNKCFQKWAPCWLKDEYGFFSFEYNLLHTKISIKFLPLHGPGIRLHINEMNASLNEYPCTFFT